jgi:hypothetical protein
MQRRHIGGDATELPAVADGELGDAEVDVEMFQLQDIIVDLVAKAAGIEVLQQDALAGDGRGIGLIRHAAGPHFISARGAVALVDLQGEDAAQVVADDEVEEEAAALPAVKVGVFVIREVLICHGQISVHVRQDVVEEPRHAQLGCIGGHCHEPGQNKESYCPASFFHGTPLLWVLRSSSLTHVSPLAHLPITSDRRPSRAWSPALVPSWPLASREPRGPRAIPRGAPHTPVPAPLWHQARHPSPPPGARGRREMSHVALTCASMPMCTYYEG